MEKTYIHWHGILKRTMGNITTVNIYEETRDKLNEVKRINSSTQPDTLKLLVDEYYNIVMEELEETRPIEPHIRKVPVDEESEKEKRKGIPDRLKDDENRANFVL